LLTNIGPGLKELVLNGCKELEDAVLIEGIRPTCGRLETLGIQECGLLTSAGAVTLFSSWSQNTGLKNINLSRCICFTDEVLETVLTHSGHTLETLHLNSLDELTKGGFQKIIGGQC